MMAKVAGKDEVVLTMEEVDATIAQINELDQTIAKFMDYVPDDILEKYFNCKTCNKFPYECECD